MQEIWKTVQGFENYDVSNLGNVRSWVDNASKRRTLPKLLKPSPDKNGYVSVSLYLNSFTIDNLEWCISKYNLSYSSIHKKGLETKNKNKASNSEKSIIGIKNNIIIYRFKSIAEAARKSECSRWGIRRCLLKQIKQTKGIEWHYA